MYNNNTSTKKDPRKKSIYTNLYTIEVFCTVNFKKPSNYNALRCVFLCTKALRFFAQLRYKNSIKTDINFLLFFKYKKE